MTMGLQINNPSCKRDEIELTLLLGNRCGLWWTPTGLWQVCHEQCGVAVETTGVYRPTHQPAPLGLGSAQQRRTGLAPLARRLLLVSLHAYYAGARAAGPTPPATERRSSTVGQI